MIRAGDFEWETFRADPFQGKFWEYPHSTCFSLRCDFRPGYCPASACKNAEQGGAKSEVITPYSLCGAELEISDTFVTRVVRTSKDILVMERQKRYKRRKSVKNLDLKSRSKNL